MATYGTVGMGALDPFAPNNLTESGSPTIGASYGSTTSPVTTSPTGATSFVAPATGVSGTPTYSTVGLNPTATTYPASYQPSTTTATSSTSPTPTTQADGQTFYSLPSQYDWSKVNTGSVVNIDGQTYTYYGSQGLKPTSVSQAGVPASMFANAPTPPLRASNAPTASSTTPTTTPTDTSVYWLRPGESITQYNARIAAMFASGTQPTATVNTPITSAQMTPTTPTPFNYPATGSPYDATALAAAYSETPQQKEQSDLIKELQGLNTQEAGKADYQNQMNTQFGVDSKQQTVDDLNTKLSTLINEAAQIKLTPQQGQGVTTAIDIRQRDGALQQNAISALAVSSLLDAAKGQLASAQAKADKAVKLIYDPIEAKIAADKANLQLIANDPLTTLQEQKQAASQMAIKDAQAAAVAEQKQNLADIFTIAANAAANIQNFTPNGQYLTASQALTAIQQAHTKGDALMIAASVGLTGGTKTGTWGATVNGKFVEGASSMLNGNAVQTNSLTGEIRTASSRAPSNSTSGQLSGEQLKQQINKQIATPEFQALSPEDKALYIQSQGGTASDFGY